MNGKHGRYQRQQPLVLVPKTTQQNKESVPLSIQFQQIEEQAKQDALQQTVTHTSKFLFNIEFKEDYVLPIDVPEAHFPLKHTVHQQVPIVVDTKVVKQNIDIDAPIQKVTNIIVPVLPSANVSQNIGHLRMHDVVYLHLAPGFTLHEFYMVPQVLVQSPNLVL